MDTELIIFMVIFMTMAVGLISFAFPEKDRKKVFIVALGFGGVILSTFGVVWLLANIIPREHKWLAIGLGTVAYSFILGFFAKKMFTLTDQADAEKSKDDNKT